MTLFRMTSLSLLLLLSSAGTASASLRDRFGSPDRENPPDRKAPIRDRIKDGRERTSTEEEGSSGTKKLLDFSQFSAGEWVSDVGMGTTVTIEADRGVGCFGPNGNEPMIFDSENPTSVDLDLGSPHKDFGGPGYGQGGKRGSAGENSVPLGKLIMMSEDCNQEIPNDDRDGGVFVFSFDKPKNIKSVGTIDFSRGITVEAKYAGGAPKSSFDFEGLGKNSFLEAILNVENVVELRVTFRDSGGLAFLEFFEPEYDPIDPVGAYGDPHFKMWDGSIYSFDGACDLVLLDHPQFDRGEGLKIHLRTKTRDDFSYISGAVVQIGDSTLEVVAGNEEGNAITYSNGLADRNVPTEIHGYPINHRAEVSTNGVLHVYGIQLGAENAIVIKSFPHLTDIRIRSSNSRQSRFGSSLGLLGNLAGEMVGRDGETVFDETTEFAQHWQVKPSEPVLFHDGMSGPSTCSFPTSSGRGRRLRQSTREVSEMDAANACAGLEDETSCISDVLAVGSLEFAQHFM